MLCRLSTFWESCPWFRLATLEPSPLRTWRGIRQIMMSFGTSITQAVGLTLRLDVATEPGCGIRMRGPWDGLATCDMFEPVDVERLVRIINTQRTPRRVDLQCFPSPMLRTSASARSRRPRSRRSRRTESLQFGSYSGRSLPARSRHW